MRLLVKISFIVFLFLDLSNETPFIGKRPDPLERTFNSSIINFVVTNITK
jgi:hypothetical protein